MLKIFHDQSLRKYWAGLGPNSQPLDQISDSLPISLQGTGREDELIFTF